MEFNGNLCSYQFSRTWDLHNFEVFSNDEPLSSSTGYLQDAVNDWINRSKRRRVSSSDSKHCCSSDDQGFETSFCSTKRTLTPEKLEDVSKKVAYPFDMVKSGGLQGDVTLNEINKRLMMRPKRSIRHPVGDLVCHPCVLTTGFGPSGKEVVAITRIHTRGRGKVIVVKTRE